MSKRTTVELSSYANSIKDSFMPVFGLRNILSAGVVAFNKLSSNDQNNLIAEANDKPSPDLDFYSDRKKLIQLKELILECLSGADQCAVDFREFANEAQNIIGAPEAPAVSIWAVNPKTIPSNNGLKIRVINDIITKQSARLKVLSPEESKLVQQLREALGPEPTQHKNTKTS